MLGSEHFQTYHKTLYRVMFADFVGEHMEADRGRLLSIVGTSQAHERWLAERRVAPTPRVRAALQSAGAAA